MKIDLRCEVCEVDFGIELLIMPKSKYDNMNLCKKHRNQIKHDNYIRDKRPPMRPMDLRVCDYCDSTGKDTKVHFSNGEYLCARHYNQVRLYEKVLERTVFDKNEVVIMEGYAEIVLYNDIHEIVARAIVDIEDLGILTKYKWGHDTSNNYARTSINGEHLGMHQLIMDTKKFGNSVLVDHINRNGLDNRKINMRITDKSNNAINTGLRISNKSGVTGVSYSKRHGLWRSYISYNKKSIDLGWHKHKEEAIVSRLEAEAKYYSDYPPQKHLFKKYNVKQGEERNE